MAEHNCISTDHIIRPKDLKAITGLSRTTVWRLEQEGDFPQRRIISPGAVGWLYSEVLEWMESREQAEE